MESKKYYVVSFSDSKQYILIADKKEGMNKLTNIENELNSYLKSLFPDETFAYYTTPKVTEISEAHASQYKDYPVLDSQALTDIKDELKREITIRQDTQELNSDCPENSVAPKY